MDPLQPIDILVLLKMSVFEEDSGHKLASELAIPQPAVQDSIARLEAVQLVMRYEGKRHVNCILARGFLAHATRWIAPAVPGAVLRGFPTSHAARLMRTKFFAGSEPYVIAVFSDEESPPAELLAEGPSVEPIHPAVPRAISRDERLRDLITIVDAFRVGTARDRKVAAEVLMECL